MLDTAVKKICIFVKFSNNKKNGLIRTNIRIFLDCGTIHLTNLQSLSSALKIAYLSKFWSSWQHRVLEGALRYSDANPPIIIRCFAPVKNLAAAVTEMEQWGAEGILCTMETAELETVLAALKHTIPIINNALCNESPGVLRMVFSFQDSCELAVNHFRQLGLRSLALLITEEFGDASNALVGPFLRITNPPSPSRASLIFSAEPKKLLDQHTPVEPVPDVLAEWLRSLPKPTGIFCPAHGSAGYLIRCCQALGLRVPEDIAVIGADNMDLCLASEPTVTSIVQAHETAGFEAIRLLQDWIAGKQPPPSPFRLGHIELHVRGSTGLRKPEICDIAGALKCIDQNACRGITVRQVIKETQSVSKPTFHRRFQEVVGKSPAEVIRDRKLEEVRRLLTTTELSLTMVSELAGFSSLAFLSKTFRRVEGVTMRDYRKNKGIPPSRQAKATR
jgi:LacI family transcriptional regulator